MVTLHGFFNISTRLTVIAGAAVLLLAYHLVHQPQRLPQPQRPQPVTQTGAPVNEQARRSRPQSARRLIC